MSAPEAACVERTAVLFVAGDYPDRALTVSPEDLDRMAAGFGEPVPVRVEHTDGPLRFGWLVRVWREGQALFGRLRFSRAAWELMRESGAEKLSLAIERGSLAIREVSLVRCPRVAGAAILPEGLACFTVDIPPGEGEDVMEDAETARQELDGLVRAGKVSPAAEDLALALLSAPEEATVLFAGEDGTRQATALRDLFRRFLQAQPPVVLLSECATAAEGPDEAGGQDGRLFAALGVTAADVRRYGARKEGQ